MGGTLPESPADPVAREVSRLALEQHAQEADLGVGVFQSAQYTEIRAAEHEFQGLFRQKKFAFHGPLAWLADLAPLLDSLHTLHTHKWIVDVRKPFGRPEHVLHYKARYTHRVAISTTD